MAESSSSSVTTEVTYDVMSSTVVRRIKAIGVDRERSAIAHRKRW